LSAIKSNISVMKMVLKIVTILSSSKLLLK
jgi:hypothetical protein